jgi:hypothetical protein
MDDDRIFAVPGESTVSVFLRLALRGLGGVRRCGANERKLFAAGLDECTGPERRIVFDQIFRF